MISPGSMVKPESPPEMPEMGSWRDLKGQSRSTAFTTPTVFHAGHLLGI